MALYYGYGELLNAPPIGPHQWRQTDCAALADNYYARGMHFSEPAVYHVLGGEGKAVGEFPILYYVVAVLYHVFGQHDLIFRLLQCLLLFLGLYYLFRLNLLFMKDIFWAMSSAFLVFTAPVLVFYGPNFMPDAPAFTFTLIGWYYFFRHVQKGRMQGYYIATASFALAGMLKITALISPLAIGIVFLLERGFGLRLRPEGKVFQGHWVGYLLPGIAVFAAVGFWFAWAIAYNARHENIYFSTQMWPIWDLSSAQIAYVFEMIAEVWWKEFFSRFTWLFMLLAGVGAIVARKHLDRLLLALTVIVGIGVTAFFLLWFYAFENHDYYFINLIPLYVLLLLLVFDAVRWRFPALLAPRPVHWYKIGFLLLLLLSARDARLDMQERIRPGGNLYTGYPAALHGAAQWLDELGISREARLICLPDPSPNSMLYMLKRPGFTQLYYPDLKKGDVRAFVQKGAAYFVVYDSTVRTHPAVMPFLGETIGSKPGLEIVAVRK